MSLSFQPSIAVIIPAFNERGRLKNIFQVVCKIPELTEIIVVDDGSTDGTELDVQEVVPTDPRLRYLRQELNQGKVRAMTTGARAAQSELLVFLDADLYNMTPESVRALIEPVRSGRVDMTIGIFRGGKFHTDLSQRVNPYLSGQRCIRRHLFFEVPLDKVVGYGIEVAFTIVGHRNHWRTRFVPLRGAYHQPSEIRRGSILRGLGWKAGMFSQIFQTYRALTPIKAPSRRRLVFLSLFIFMLVIVGLSLVYNHSRADSHISAQSLPAFDFGDAKRLLVIAPHPDDETLGTGGIIQEALARGLQVKVLVFTNGDGQIPAVVTLQKEITPTGADFIRDGMIRQQESLNALKILGVPPENASYLGYPDRQLQKLWLDDWQHDCPLKGEFTQTTRVPYPSAYQPGAEYCGSTVMDSVKTILADYQPDLIMMPHMNDNHPDHRAASQFTMMGLAELMAQNPNYQPQTWGYIIHFGNYPPIRGWHQNASLAPPLPLISPGEIWTRLDLTPAQEATKALAIRAYTSQMRLMKSFLASFARQDEIFERINILDYNRNLPVAVEINQAAGLDTLNPDAPAENSQLATLAANSEKVIPSSSGSPIDNATLNTPGIASTRQLLLPGANLVDLQVGTLLNNLLVSARTRGSLLPDVSYQIQYKFTDGSTKTCSLGKDATRLSSTSYACNLDISTIPSPAVTGFDAEVNNRVNLDRSGWYFLILR